MKQEKNMRYIIADIHGCYNEYINLLKKIKFTDKDTLYILGDVVDRGPEPIKILQDMMKRKNVVHFIGNHEFMMYTILKKLTVEITAENCENYLETDDILKYNQKYKVCAVPQKTVHAEHREMLQKIKDRDKEGMKELVIRHLANLIDFAIMSAKGDIPEFEYGHI